jgi:hypothetical protein
VAKAELRAGASLDLLNQSELRDALSDSRAQEYAALRGIKKIRLPLVSGTPANSAVSFGGHTGGGLLATPQSGFKWAIVHLVINGMTASSSAPDVINIRLQGQTIWQLNGNQFAQIFPVGAIVLDGGETLDYKSVGTFAATGTITATGSAWEVPGELVGKLL